MKKISVLLLLSTMVLASCQGEENFHKSNTIKVGLEYSSYYSVREPIKDIPSGSDVSFDVSFVPSYTFLSCSYNNYDIKVLSDTSLTLTLKDVIYPMMVSLTITKEEQKTPTIDTGDTTPVEREANSIVYHHEDTTTITKADHQEQIHGYHLREQALNGYDLFPQKEGKQLVCWNTKEDLSGKNVYFNNRVPYSTTDLYPVYLDITPISEMTFSLDTKGAVLTSYLGEEKTVVLPSTFQGKNVYSIAKNAFQNKKIKKLFLPREIKEVQYHAFVNTKIREFIFCDTLTEIPSSSFDQCKVKTVHINALQKPRSSGTYFDAFNDKIDYLASVKDEKKIVIFAGSSTRYGYSSPLIEKAFPGYKVVNMGVFAYVNMLPQLSVILHYMKKGDILLHTPEFDSWALDCQFGTEAAFESELFYMFEGNYENLSLLDLNDYPYFFTSFQSYQERRKAMPNRDYSYQSKHYDDEENYHAEDTYNVEGDFIMHRDGHPVNERIYQPETPYTLDTISMNRIGNLDQIYQNLTNLGIQVLYTFAPKNIYSLTSNSTRELRDELYTYISEHLSVPVLGTLEESLYPATYFYKIDNHLSSEACITHTNRIIKEMKKYIKAEKKSES